MALNGTSSALDYQTYSKNGAVSGTDKSKENGGTGRIGRSGNPN